MFIPNAIYPDSDLGNDRFTLFSRDPLRIRQVLTNLLVNALDATADQPEPRISIRTRREGEVWTTIDGPDGEIRLFGRSEERDDDVLLVATWAYGASTGESALGPIVARTLVVTACLAVAFIGVGLWVSSLANTPERAMVLALAVWLVAVALHDFALIGVLLQTRLEPELVFALAAINPVETARLAVLSGVDPELSVLGPVGFWLANTLGANFTFAAGTLWPLLLGLLAAWRASARLTRMDLVG